MINLGPESIKKGFLLAGIVSLSFAIKSLPSESKQPEDLIFKAPKPYYTQKLVNTEYFAGVGGRKKLKSVNMQMSKNKVKKKTPAKKIIHKTIEQRQKELDKNLAENQASLDQVMKQIKRDIDQLEKEGFGADDLKEFQELSERTTVSKMEKVQKEEPKKRFLGLF